MPTVSSPGDRRAMLSAALGISAVGAGVAASDHLTAYPVLTAQAVRYGVAAAILAVVVRGSGRSEARLGARGWAGLVALAVTGMALFNVAVVRAVTSGEPAVVATVVGLAPIGLALVVPALERRRPTPAIVAGACLAATGAAVVEGYGHADAAALAWSAVALACEVAFTVLAAPLLRTLTPLGLSLRACGLAAVLMAAASLAMDGREAIARPGPGEAAAVAYLAVASTALAFVAWYRSVAHLGPERAGLFSGLMPVSAALVGAAVTPAPFRLVIVTGAAMVGLGLAVGLTGGRRRRGPRAADGPSAGWPPGDETRPGPEPVPA